ncbi:four-carbon acid sugar kinase family protein [Synechococcus sp. MIT S1220]|uniref:four-carbon acid sugar kinase family protein n=1 Tax=Synechococcus sp. MIT S1220 TaxID=3082549 RepID=UPI0039AFE6C8
MSFTNGAVDLWVVAACFNEESVILRFIERVLAVEEVDRLVLIDDRSSDGTVQTIRQWQQSHPEALVTLLELTRNFGKEAAMLAGLDHANGRCDAVVVIDSDLQHPPERISLMVSAWHREISAQLDQALAAEGLARAEVHLVSRGDSTLRGHGVLEPDTLQEAFGLFDATFHVPAFLEGGRTTVNGVHLLHGQPVHTTPFAQDRLFRFGTSDLAAWLEEKSSGAIRRTDVQRISGRELDAACGAGLPRLVDRLRKLRGQRACGGGCRAARAAERICGCGAGPPR